MALIEFDYFSDTKMFNLDEGVTAIDRKTLTILAFSEMCHLEGSNRAIARTYVLTGLHLPKRNHLLTALQTGTDLWMRWQGAASIAEMVALRVGPAFALPAAGVMFAAPDLLKCASIDFLLHHDKHHSSSKYKGSYAYFDETGEAVFKGPKKWSEE